MSALSPAQRWVLATAAILNHRHGKALDRIGGRARPTGSFEAFFLLSSSWGVQTPAEAEACLAWLARAGHRVRWEEEGAGPAQAFVGWDACRLAHVAGWAHVAYLLDAERAFHWMTVAAGLLQGAYGSWAEVGQSYVRGLRVWSDGEAETVDPTAQSVAALVSDPASPWVELPFRTDLAGAACPAPAAARVVRAGPGGDEPTIAGAVRAAGPGGRVVVAAGVYTESLAPEHAVEIEAEGEVTLVSAGEPCVRVTGERCVVLRGLRLRAEETPKGAPLNAVHVARGFARLEACEVEASHDGVQLRDWGIAHVVGSRVRAAGHAGLHALAGHFVVADAEISGAGAHGVLLEAKGPSSVERSRISSCGGAGVFATDDVVLALRDVTVEGCGAPAGVVLGKQARLALAGGAVRGGDGGGVFFQEASGGSLERCELTGTALAGLDLGSTGTVTAEHVRVAGGKTSGVLLRPGARALLADASLEDNAAGHVWVMKGAELLLADATVRGGALALWVQGGGSAFVHGSTFEGQSGHGVDAQPGAHVHLGLTRVVGQGGDALSAGEGAEVHAGLAELGPGGGAGVRAAAGARVSLEACRASTVAGAVERHDADEAAAREAWTGAFGARVEALLQGGDEDEVDGDEEEDEEGDEDDDEDEDDEDPE